MIRFLLTFWLLMIVGIQAHAATIGTGDLNTNQFVITGLSKVSLRNGASVTNLTFNSFTICDPGTTNCTTYNWPLTNYVSGQFLTVITNGTNVFIVGTNLPTSTVVFDTIEELVATPIPLPGIGMLAYVRDPLRSGPLAFYPASVDTTNRFDTYASLNGPGNWKRPPDPNVYPQHGVVTGGLVTNDTLVAALVLQSSRATGKVVYSGTDEFLETDDVPLLENNVLFFEDGAQATGLNLSSLDLTNAAVYGAYHIAAVASPSTGAYHLTNSTVLIQSPTFLGYSGNPVVNSGSSVRIFTFDSTGFVLQAGNGLTNLVVGDASGYSGTGTNFLSDDGTFKVAGGSGGTTINATDGYLPYRVNSTTFGDSPWYRISPTAMGGFGSTNRFLISANDNLFIGPSIGSLTASGTDNTGVGGNNTLEAITSGNNNSAFGWGALLSLTTGSDNTAIGLNAGGSITSGGTGVFVGEAAGDQTTGSSIVAVGYFAGHTNTTGANNTYLGYNANPTTGGNNNETVIGNGAVGNGSNTATIGNSSVTSLWLASRVGWFRGTGSPEGVVTAPIGSYFTREDGGAGTSFYVKESGTGDTGWVAVSTGAGSGITGSGTAGNVPVWTAATSQADSVMKISSIGAVTEVESLAVTNFVIATEFYTATGSWDATGLAPGGDLFMASNDIDMGPSGLGRITNAASINNVVITAPASTATLTLGSGKTITLNNTMTHNGTDGTTMTFPTTSATIARTDAGQGFVGTNYFGSAIILADGASANPAIQWIDGSDAPGLYYNPTNNRLVVASGALQYVAFDFAVARVSLRSTGYYSWVSDANPSTSSHDTLIGRDAAATVQLGLDASTATAQTLKAHDGSGSDKDGARMTIGAGRPTGTGVIPRVMIAVSTNAVSGSTALNYGTPVAVGGTLKVNTTTTGNVGGGEDDLISYAVPAAELGVNGDYLEYDCWGTFAANANTARLKVFFGATALIDTTSLLFNGVAWRAHGKIVRTGATTQEATCEITIGGTLLSAVNSTITAQSNPAETLSGLVTFKVTGEDTGGIPADDKVIQKAMVIRWFPAN